MNVEFNRKQPDSGNQATIQILRHMTRLDQAKSESELNRLLPDVLSAIGHGTLAERCYIFERDPDHQEQFDRTHTWSLTPSGLAFPIPQRLTIQQLPHWIKPFQEGQVLVFEDWPRQGQDTPVEYQALHVPGVSSRILFPLFFSHRVNGFVCLDNPKDIPSPLMLQLLVSLGGHIGTVKKNLRSAIDLAKSQIQLQESLLSQTYEKQLLEALCIDYTTVYCCDLLADTIVVVKQGESTNATRIAQTLAQNRLGHNSHSYSFMLQYYYDHCVVHESAPDFLQRLSAQHIMEVLQHQDRAAFRFRTRANAAGDQHFEVQVARLHQTEGFQIVAGFRHIDDIIMEEARQKTALENALAQAELNNEIISAISKLYWLIYRIDLETGTFEEVATGSDIHSLTGYHGNTAQHFREACRNWIDPEFHETMMAFLDLNTLPHRLEQVDNVSCEYRAISGNWHTCRFIVKKRDAQGRATRVLYVVRKTTEQKEEMLRLQDTLRMAALEAQRANVAKTDFLRRMSHDVRTPINAIRGMVTIANHYPDNMEKQQECRDKIMTASGFLLDLVNNSLDMIKLESGRITLEEKPFDLLEVLNETVSIVEVQGQSVSISVEAQFAGIHHPHLLGSPLHLRQILQNIVSNGVKYNRQGGSVTLICQETACNGTIASFVITCRDTGLGMSPEFVTHAFEPFTQEHSDARSVYTGTGLGLAIVKELVEMMGGTITLESQQGVGSQFTLTLPFQLDLTCEANQAVSPEPHGNPLRGIRVLLAEDNEINMEIASFLLERAGATVTAVQNGQEAIDTFSQAPSGSFDLILMDIMMPQVNGLDAARAIRSLNRPDAAQIPIFAMTANVFLEDIERSKQAGMNEHLSKPLVEQELLELVQKYTQGSRGPAHPYIHSV